MKTEKYTAEKSNILYSKNIAMITAIFFLFSEQQELKSFS